MKNYQFLILTFVLFLTGCSSYISVIQPSRQNNLVLHDSDSGGQTFVSKFDGLSQVRFFIRKEASSTGLVKFSINDPSSGKSLYKFSHSVNDLPEKGYFSFEFPEIDNSNQKMYFASLSYEGQDSVSLGSADGAQYINGSAYRNNTPIDAQLAFQLGHKKWTLISGLGKELAGWLCYILVGLLLFVVPGWGIMSWLLPGWHKNDGLERLLFSFCFTSALFPIIFLWAKLIHIPLGSWLPVTFLFIGLGLIMLKNIKKNKLPRPSRANSPSILKNLLFYITFIIVLGGVILSRFWVVRNLDIPLWGDSYHHSLIVQLLNENKGLFDNWLPYADLYGLSYHYGFHAVSVAYQWIIGISSPQAILMMGQLLNILAVVALYPLGKMLGQNRWSGLAAILFGGLLFSMPNAYTNWGRYTQLAGQVILPSTILITWLLIKNFREGKWLIADKKTLFQILLVGWVFWCGLALIHIRVAVFAVMAIPILLILGIDRKNAGYRLLVLFLLALGSLALYIPWVPSIIEGQLMNLISHYFQTPVNSSVGMSIQDSDKIQNIFAYLPTWAWLGMFISLGWGLWRRSLEVFFLSSWWLLVVLSANPGWVGIPGNGAITNFALMIAFYIPAGVLLGGVAGWFFNLPNSTIMKQNIARIGLSTAMIIAAIFGARLRVADINASQNALSVRPDIVAAEWIQNNIPEDSRFYVNSFFAYGGTLVVGSDGGWWLPLLAKRSTTLPPLTYGIEPGPVEDYIAYVNYLPRMVQEQGIADPDIYKLFRAYGVTHIYVGQQQGSVNAPPGTQIDIDDLLQSPFYTPIYHADRVWIFQLVPNNET